MYTQLNQLKKTNSKNKEAYAHLESEIFFANENVNFTYLQMLVARYQDQMHQFKIVVSRGNSITLLNKVSDQVQVLAKQLQRVNELLNARIFILDKKMKAQAVSKEVSQLQGLSNQYKSELNTIAQLNQQLFNFRSVLDKALQTELSLRQGLPGMGGQGWLDMGAELLIVPRLTYHLMVSIGRGIADTVMSEASLFWVLFAMLELSWIGAYYAIKRFFRKHVSVIKRHAASHIDVKQLALQVGSHCLLGATVLANLMTVFILCKLPFANYSFVLNLGLIILLFKGLITTARLSLVETLQDRAGQDVRLYQRLKWTFFVGGVVTVLTVFVNQLPVIYELKDLFDRMFLVFLFVVSVLLLRSREMLPQLIVAHIDEAHFYVRRMVRLFSLLIPLIFMVNSMVGLCGYVNLVLTMSWYEGIFLMLLVGYLVIRGLLSEGLMWLSDWAIRMSANGWLWTEAFLKPIDKVVRAGLFLSFWAVLFLLYGWDRQSPVVERLYKLLHYHVVDVLNTTITPIAIIEVLVVMSFLFWAARWTREFVFRILATRTRDMGVRNSIAMFSQYAMITVGILICLRVLGIDFKALAVVAGMFAFGVGLGLRDLVNNFACGFLLLIERPLKVGDIVVIEGQEGEVIHIGGRAVTIRTFDHMEMMVPNSEVFNKSFINWTAKDTIVRTVIDMKINRHDNPHQIQSIIHDVLRNFKEVLTDPVPEVFLKELNDSLSEFEVRYYINVRHVRSRVWMRSEILFAIWDAFEKAGIEAPYPIHAVRVKEGEPVYMAPG